MVTRPAHTAPGITVTLPQGKGAHALTAQWQSIGYLRASWRAV